MEKTKEQTEFESYSGMYQQGDLVYCNDVEEELTKEQAIELFKNNEDIVIMAAGAGNFREVFTTLGFQEVELILGGGSGCDCTFGIKNEQGWFVGQQEPISPMCGYRYVISDLIECCETLDQLSKKIEDF